MPDGSWELDSTSVLGTLEALVESWVVVAVKLDGRLSRGYIIEQSALSLLFQYRGASLRSESMMYSRGMPAKDGGGNGLGTKEWTDSTDSVG